MGTVNAGLEVRGVLPSVLCGALTSGFHERVGDTGAESTEVPVLLGKLGIAEVSRSKRKGTPTRVA